MLVYCTFTSVFKYRTIQDILPIFVIIMVFLWQCLYIFNASRSFGDIIHFIYQYFVFPYTIYTFYYVGIIFIHAIIPFYALSNFYANQQTYLWFKSKLFSSFWCRYFKSQMFSWGNLRFNVKCQRNWILREREKKHRSREKKSISINHTIHWIKNILFVYSNWNIKFLTFF